MARERRVGLRTNAQPGIGQLLETNNRMCQNMGADHQFVLKMEGICNAAASYDHHLCTLQDDNKIDTYNNTLDGANKLIYLMAKALDELTRPGAQGQDTFSADAPLAHLATTMVSEISEDLALAASDVANLNLEIQRITGRLGVHATKLLKHANQAAARNA